MEEEHRPAIARYLQRFENLTPNTRFTAVDFPRNTDTSQDGGFSFLGTASQRVTKTSRISDAPDSSRTSPLGSKSPVPKTAHSRSQSVASNSKLEQLLSRLETRHHDAEQTEQDRPRPGQQEARIKILLKKLRDKDGLITDLESRLSRASEDAKTRNNQISEYKQIIEEYDFKFQGLLDKTNASLERVVVQKNAEITKLKEETAAAVEAERGKVFSIRKEYKSRLSELEQELEKQAQLMRLMQDENKKLVDDYSASQNELSKIKQKLSDSHFLSKTDYRLLESHFQDLETMQSSLLAENERLRAMVEEKSAETTQQASKVALACNLIYKTRVDVAQLTRALRVIKQTPNISALTMLLALKKDPATTIEGSPYDQLTSDLDLLSRDVKELESGLMEWFTDASGKACLVS